MYASSVSAVPASGHIVPLLDLALSMAEACEKADVGRTCAGEADIEAAVSDVLSNAGIASHVEVGANEIAVMPTGANVASHVDAFVRAFG
jgi:hypothetical protein